MSTLAKHEIQTAKQGEGLDGYIQNQCSCGWKGKLHYAHNDYQFSNCSEERKEHLKDESRKLNELKQFTGLAR